MSKKLILSFSIIFLILPFLSIILFGTVYISDLQIQQDSAELVGLYSSILALGLIGALLSILYFFLFVRKIDKVTRLKWVLISTFVSLILYELFVFLGLFEVLFLNGKAVLDNQKIINALMYLPMLLIPFLMLGPIFGFARLYVDGGPGKKQNRIIIN